MSKRRGLSVDEKRSRMMDFFYEKKDFFQLKELEKLCQKEKGITSMSVKDILMSLVDDGLVDTEKIGTSVYFWAFPSKASQNRKRKIDDLTESLEETKQKIRATEEMVAKATVGREKNDNRELTLSRLSQKQSEHEQLTQQLKRYRDCDPEVMEQMREEAEVSLQAANRWTDNIFAIKSWAKKNFNLDGNVMNQQFEIPEDLDYLE